MTSSDQVKVKDNFNRYPLPALAVAHYVIYLKLGRDLVGGGAFVKYGPADVRTVNG